MTHQIDAILVNRKVALHLLDHVNHVAFGRGQIHRNRPAAFRTDDYVTALFGGAPDRTVVVTRKEAVFISAHSVQRDDHGPFLLRVVILRDIKTVWLDRVVKGGTVGPVNVTPNCAQRVFAPGDLIECRRGGRDYWFYVRLFEGGGT